MKNKNLYNSKTGKIVYWISTLWLASGMFASGILQLSHAKAEGSTSPPGTEGIAHLGYPVYFLTILGIWKILGVTAILVPKFPLMKEWAYAGFFFLVTGAMFSHVASGDPVRDLFPALLLFTLLILSWMFRPVSRKITSVTNSYQKTETEKHSKEFEFAV